jgi:type VI secretion system secreted protein Hcp
MALNAYLTLKGQKQGDIKGGVTQKGREGSILVHAFSNQVISPGDATTGRPTGKRQHQPLVILKEIDRSSPQLWSALVNNENITGWQLRFWAAGLAGGAGAGGGVEKQIYTIELTNASIASMREYMLDNDDPALMKFPLLEEITFTYQKIQWTWTDPTTVASDDWESPVT